MTRVCAARTTRTTKGDPLSGHEQKEWSSYLHDGRSIHVRQLGKGWQVTCGDATETADDLRAAMRAAIGLSEGERRSEPARDFALRRWIEHHAEQIERESA